MRQNNVVCKEICTEKPENLLQVIKWKRNLFGVDFQRCTYGSSLVQHGGNLLDPKFKVCAPQRMCGTLPLVLAFCSAQKC